MVMGEWENEDGWNDHSINLIKHVHMDKTTNKTSYLDLHNDLALGDAHTVRTCLTLELSDVPIPTWKTFSTVTPNQGMQ